jgi:hypothetical protein
MSKTVSTASQLIQDDASYWVELFQSRSKTADDSRSTLFPQSFPDADLAIYEKIVNVACGFDTTVHHQAEIQLAQSIVCKSALELFGVVKPTDADDVSIAAAAALSDEHRTTCFTLYQLQVLVEAAIRRGLMQRHRMLTLADLKLTEFPIFYLFSTAKSFSAVEPERRRLYQYLLSLTQELTLANMLTPYAESNVQHSTAFRVKYVPVSDRECDLLANIIFPRCQSKGSNALFPCNLSTTLLLALRRLLDEQAARAQAGALDFERKSSKLYHALMTVFVTSISNLQDANQEVQELGEVASSRGENFSFWLNLEQLSRAGCCQRQMAMTAELYWSAEFALVYKILPLALHIPHTLQRTYDQLRESIEVTQNISQTRSTLLH